MNDLTLKHYMPSSVAATLGNKPPTHRNCIEATQVLDRKGRVVKAGIARPGKTARDRARAES